MQLPIMNSERSKSGLPCHDLLVKMRTMVKKNSKSVNAKIELDKLVHTMVVPTRR